VEVGCEEDEKGGLQPIMGDPTPIAFKPHEEATIFVNDNL